MDFNQFISNPYISGFIVNLATELLKIPVKKIEKSEFVANFKKKFFDFVGKSDRGNNLKIERFNNMFVIKIPNSREDFILKEEDLEKIATAIYIFYEKNNSLNSLEDYLRNNKTIFGDYIDQRGAYKPIGKVNKYYENVDLKNLDDLND